MNQKTIRNGLILGGVLCGGIFLGWSIPIPNPFVGEGKIVGNRGAVLYESSVDYKYIDPLLSCDIGTENSFPELAPIKASISTLVSTEIRQQDATNISIYLRSLKGARWFEINGDENYAPASLLKVFVMMAYYKADDDTRNGSILGRRLAFEGSANPALDDPGEVIPHLKNGASYSVNKLIDQMIVYSDNNAMATLIDGFDQKTLQDFQNIFSDLRIPSPASQSEEAMNFMPVDSYAMVFRVLFGSTYLSRQYSEKALALLSGVQYVNGINAGVPAGIAVAHKFGVRSIPASQNGGTAGAELHDCGIVYYPNHPYLLCIMTHGSDFGKLQSVHALDSGSDGIAALEPFACAADLADQHIGKRE
jgi:beta-lactamase class A